MTIHQQRLADLRTQLQQQQLDGFLVPLTDEHMSEYVGAYAQRLQWLTGFSGSAGLAAILPDRAAMFIDGRYTIQVRAQVDGDLYDYCQVPALPVQNWLAEHAAPGSRIGYDPWLTGRGFLHDAGLLLAARNIELVPIAANPIDHIWPDRPSPSLAPARPYPTRLSGQPSADKRRDIARALQQAHADHVVLSALDSIAWLFNIRGEDIWRTPVVRAFAIVHADASAELFLDPAKISAELVQHLGEDVRLQDYADFAPALGQLEGRVQVDPKTAVVAIFGALAQGSAQIAEARDPCILPKAAKNSTEITGMRNAHLRDGVAMVKFLHSIDADPPEDELDAAARLEDFRRESNLLCDLSFDTISAIDANAALPHYHPAPDTNLPFAGAQIYLVDSGGQYEDGTTDITRTIALKAPDDALRDHYTRVLKGHIALATARFPKGTRGGQLDVLARQYLWSAGLDYAHGTGHGVGHFLAVHEGPQRIAAASSWAAIGEVLHPGMVISNEPGYYQSGDYGIRIENLVVVVPDSRSEDSADMLAFETITLAPIDCRLIDPSLLTDLEIEWLDCYHARVREALTESVSGACREWLIAATEPLASQLSL